MARKSVSKTLLPAGLRVLAVEDETLIALDLEDMLLGSGAGDVIVARTLADVQRAIAGSEIDIAIINYNPSTEAASDIETAKAVQDSGIPFLFATGSDAARTAGEFSEAMFVSKPYSRETIVSAVLATLDRTRSAS